MSRGSSTSRGRRASRGGGSARRGRSASRERGSVRRGRGMRAGGEGMRAGGERVEEVKPTGKKTERQVKAVRY